MAEEKMTLVDLRKALARQEQIDEQSAGMFLQELLTAIVDGLKQDKQVRINGLGTFKLQWVEPRKSVNISTGEPIILDGYQKLSFTPEQGLKERINEPFADYAAVEINEAGEAINTIRKPKADPIQKMDEQAEEIKDLLADIGTVVDVPQAVVEETPAEVSPLVAEPQPEPEPVVLSEPEPTPEPEPAPAVEPQPEPKPYKPIYESVLEEPVREEPKKKRRFWPWLITLIILLLLAAGLGVAYYFYQEEAEEWMDDAKDWIEEKTDSFKTTITSYCESDPTPKEEKTDMISFEELVAQDLAQNGGNESSNDFFENRTYDDYLATETVRPGSRLTLIAEKYYGTKDLWVFIYEANIEQISNPADIEVGSVLRIPDLPDSVLYYESPYIQEKVHQLIDRYLER